MPAALAGAEGDAYKSDLIVVALEQPGGQPADAPQLKKLWASTAAGA